MSFLNVKNRAESSLASGISDSDLSATLATGEGANFPASNFNITIDDEIILCSSRSTDVLTIERGAEGTTPAAHAQDAVVELRITAGIIEELQISAKTYVPKALFCSMTESYADINPNTTARFSAFDIPFDMTVNKITFRCSGAFGTAGTFDYAIYAEDGQSIIFSGTSANVAAQGIVTISVSSVSLPAGRYYIGIVGNGTSVFKLTAYITAGDIHELSDAVTSEPKLTGTKTVSAGELPATFNPTTDLTDQSTISQWVFRLDN